MKNDKVLKSNKIHWNLRVLKEDLKSGEDFSQWRQNGKQYGSQMLLSTSRHYKQEIIGNIYEGRL